MPPVRPDGSVVAAGSLLCTAPPLCRLAFIRSALARYSSALGGVVVAQRLLRDPLYRYTVSVGYGALLSSLVE